MTGRQKREPKLYFKDGTITSYGLYIKRVNEIYQADKQVGASLRYYYYILNNEAAFKEGIKNADNIFSHYTMIARDFGRIPWDAIQDDIRPTLGYTGKYQTREEYVGLAIDFLKNAHRTYTIPRWYSQQYHVEVWLEKAALGRKFEVVLEPLEIRIPIHRGYSSGGFLNKNQKRLKAILRQDKRIVILYFGDWNPSGEDIERAMKERLRKFGLDHNIEFIRVALTKEQIERYNLPSAPAKEGDTRTKKFVKKHGDKTVDLDAFVALHPEAFNELIINSITRSYFNEEDYRQQLVLQDKERKKIRRLVNKKVAFRDEL